MSRKLLIFLLATLLLVPSAWAADVGIFQTKTGQTCAQRVASPVAGQSWCFDADANALKLWNGTAWVSVSGAQPLPAYTYATLPAAGTAGRLARVTDDVRGVWMDQGSRWFSLSGQVVNIEEFGASPTGTAAANSTAIQAALDAIPSSGGALYIPRGTYSFNTTLSRSISRLTIFGSGYASRLNYTGTGDAFNFNKAGSSSLDFLTLRDFEILGQSGTADGIWIERYAHVNISGVSVQEMGGLGFRLRGVFDASAFAIRANQNSAGGILLEDMASPIRQANNIHIAGSWFSDNTNYQLRHTDGQGLSLVGNVFESNNSLYDGIRLTTTFGANISGNYFEANRYDIHIGDTGGTITRGVHIAGNQFHSATGTALRIERAASTVVTANRFSTSSGITILSGAADTVLIENNGHTLTDSGTRTRELVGGAWDSLTVTATGARITKHLSASTTWNPPNIVDGAVTSTTVTVTGAALGDTVSVGFSAGAAIDYIMYGHVQAADTVRVVLFNKRGVDLDLGSGTLRVDVWGH